MSELLSVVIAFRDRDLERAERCLSSLASQSFEGFELILVDYGSAEATASALRRLVARFDFCRLVYSDTRGQPWNRSRALNIGVRKAAAPFVMTSDVDMIFSGGFLAALAERLHDDRVVYCSPHLLPEGFGRWDDVERLGREQRTAGRTARGGCCALSTALLHRIRGFDEYYRYWGVEDRDLHHRLLAEGLEEVWLDDLPGAPPLFHQWHPPLDHKTAGFLPPGFWGRAEAHFLAHRSERVRNEPRWGAVRTAADRPVLAFLDFETGALHRLPELTVLEGDPYDNRFLSRVLRTFWDLPSGHAVAVSRALHPRRRPTLDALLRLANAFLRRAHLEAELGYRPNVVHAFLAELAQVHRTPVSDYYFGFPAGDGFDLLVRA